MGVKPMRRVKNVMSSVKILNDFSFLKWRSGNLQSGKRRGAIIFNFKQRAFHTHNMTSHFACATCKSTCKLQNAFYWRNCCRRRYSNPHLHHAVLLQVCQSVTKKLSETTSSSKGTDGAAVDKRIRKTPEFALGQSFQVIETLLEQHYVASVSDLSVLVILAKRM